MANIPDFTDKNKTLDPASIAQIFQRRAEIENQQNQQRLNNSNDRIKRITDAITTGQQIASNMMDLAEKRQKLSDMQTASAGQANVQSILTSPQPQAPAPTATSTAGADTGNPIGTVPVMPSPEQTQTYQGALQKRKNDLSAALIQSDRKGVTDIMAKQMFGSPEKQPGADFQSKTVTYNGEPKEVAFDPRTANYYDPVTKERLTGDITPYGMSSATAEQRRLSRIDKQAESMGKDLNDLAINSNSPAGISAKRALYAKSGLNLIEQTKNQPGGADKRQMAELQMEVARVLTGQGVMTNETLNSLASDTAESKVKNWEEWLTNNPTGVRQQAFIDRFQTTLERQANFHEKSLANYKQKTMSKYTAFESQAPKDFSDSLRQAGYDPAAYKTTRKLVPLGPEESPVEFDQFQPGGKTVKPVGGMPSIDEIDAELARRK